MSIANLELVIETAARNAARKTSDLTSALLEEAFEAVKFGEARSRDPEEVRNTAFHEAGHTIMYWLSGWWPSYVTIVSRGTHGGYMAPCAAEAERGTLTREQLLERIRMAFGGRAAEVLVYGPEKGVSTGASSDLEHANNLARQMVCRLGMDDEFGLLIPSNRESSKVDDAVNRILRQEMDKTLELLRKNRKHLDVVAEALVARERVTSSDLQAILPATGAAIGSSPEPTQ